MAYNLTNLSSAITPAELFTGVNDATNGLIGLSILMITFFTILIIGSTVRNRDMADTFITSSFITTIVGMILLAIGMIEFSLAQIPVGLFIIGLLIKVFIER
jgi:hypothetical protein